MSGDLRRGKTQSYAIMRYRQPGGIHDAVNVATEWPRRTVDEVPQQPAKQAVGGGSGSQAATPTPRSPTLQPRDWHKFGSAYVTVSNQHNAGEDDDLNPAFASTIAAGLIKAKAEVALLTDPEKRVVLLIDGGHYKEDIILDSPLIDIVGRGDPVITGNFIVNPMTEDLLIEGITFESQNPNPAFWLQAMTGPLDLSAFFAVRIRRCTMIGEQLVFRASRRFYGESNVIVQTTNDGFSLQVPAFLFEFNPMDRKWSRMKDCTIQCFEDIEGIGTPPLTYPLYKGYAVKATAKTGLPIVFGGYAMGTIEFDTNNWALTSGLLMDHSAIYGASTAEGYSLLYRHCELHGGILVPERRGLIHGIIRGWNAGVDQIPGRLFIDNSSIHSEAVAVFDHDPLQTSPTDCGGYIWVRNSLPLSEFDGSVTSLLYNPVSTGVANIILSPSPNGWSPGSITLNEYTTSASPIPSLALLDPYMI